MAGEAQDTFNDEFEAAFTDAVGDKTFDKEKKTAEPPEDKKQESKDANVGDEEGKDAKLPDDKPLDEGKDADKKDGGEPPTDKKADPPEPTAEQQIIADLQREIEELKKATAKPVEQTPEQKQEAENKKKESEWYAKDFTEDWPDIAKAINQQMAAIRAEVKSQLESMAKGFQPYVQQTANNAFLTELRSLHPDFDGVRDKFITWIKGQPKPVANAYANVVKEGTAADVAALVTVYKGTLKSSDNQDSKETDKEKEDRLRNMEDVGSRETSTHHDVDATDFDGAFDEAVKKAI